MRSRLGGLTITETTTPHIVHAIADALVYLDDHGILHAAFRLSCIFITGVTSLEKQRN